MHDKHRADRERKTEKMPHTIRIPMCHHRPSQYRFIYMEFMLLSVFVFKYGIFILYWSMKIIKYHFGTFLFFLSPLFFGRSLKCHTKYARDSIKNSNEVPYSLLDVKDTLIRYRSEREGRCTPSQLSITFNLEITISLWFHKEWRLSLTSSLVYSYSLARAFWCSINFNVNVIWNFIFIIMSFVNV